MAYDTGPRIVMDAWGVTRVPLAENARPGDPVIYHSGWDKADNDSTPATLFCVEGGLAGETVHVAAGMVIDGFAGTQGGVIYFGDNGAYAESGTKICGRMLTATLGVVGASMIPV